MRLFNIYLIVINMFNSYFVREKKLKNIIIIKNLLKILKLFIIIKV